MSATETQREATLATLFYIQLSFILLHEYRHLCQPAFGPEFWNEIAEESADGSIESQAREIDADGFSVDGVLTRLIIEPRRQDAVDLLARDATDEMLIASFVLAVGAFFYVRPPAVFDEIKLYALTHPPQAARMNEVMHRVRAWSLQNRPMVISWLTLERYQALMLAVEDATVETSGRGNWRDQNAFLVTQLGTEYFQRLHRELDALIMREGRITAIATA